MQIQAAGQIFRISKYRVLKTGLYGALKYFQHLFEIIMERTEIYKVNSSGIKEAVNMMDSGFQSSGGSKVQRLLN